MKHLTSLEIDSFQNRIWDFYEENKRPMPFRDNTSSYYVVVSELMLQQTQVPTVLRKFPEFIDKFPDFKTLAKASLGEVIEQWQGLGYNRRAKFLHQIAQKVIMETDGTLPLDPEKLITFPGIGKATSASIYVFATNKPLAFIETNVRRIYIHHFFSDKSEIADTEIMPLVEQTLDHKNPREWYYALMDYGTHLGKTIKNPNRKSKHYTKQSKFEGSSRQVRGEILRILLKGETLKKLDIKKQITGEKKYLDKALQELLKEKMIAEIKGTYSIK